jgi:hypothetical protein
MTTERSVFLGTVTSGGRFEGRRVRRDGSELIEWSAALAKISYILWIDDFSCSPGLTLEDSIEAAYDSKRRNPHATIILTEHIVLGNLTVKETAATPGRKILELR